MAEIPNRFWVGCIIIFMISISCIATAQQLCDINQDVYQNQSTSAMVVTMEFTDSCKDADSYVYVYTKDGKEVAQGTVPDMQTRSFTFDVPGTGTIRFNCRGTGHNSTGHCLSRLISASAK
jgi:hypothetical protein